MSGLKMREVKPLKTLLLVWLIGFVFCFAVFGGIAYFSGSMTFIEAFLLSVVIPLIPVVQMITGQP